MEAFLLLVFAALAALTALLELSKRKSSKQETTNTDLIRFRNNYVIVYALMMGAFPAASRCSDGATAYVSDVAISLTMHVACAAGDWLQGPYVYALYQYYGFDRGQIGRLFIGGFASSMIFGTLVGSLADKQ